MILRLLNLKEIKLLIKYFNVEHTDDENFIKIIASHNGYEKDFNCVHRREIAINKTNYNLVGRDDLFKKKRWKTIKL